MEEEEYIVRFYYYFLSRSFSKVFKQVFNDDVGLQECNRFRFVILKISYEVIPFFTHSINNFFGQILYIILLNCKICEVTCVNYFFLSFLFSTFFTKNKFVDLFGCINLLKVEPYANWFSRQKCLPLNFVYEQQLKAFLRVPMPNSELKLKYIFKHK